MKRELLGAAAAFVLSTSLAAADDDRHSTQKEDTSTPRSSKSPSRATQQAMTQIKSAHRALGRGDTLDAMAALKRSERMLKKAQESPPTKVVIQQIDEAIELLAADPEPEPVELDALAAVIRKNKAWLDPAVSEHVYQAERAAEIGDNEGATKSLQIARAQLVSDAAAQPTDDTYLRVLAAQRALANKDTARATKILYGIPAVAAERRVTAPLGPVRTKLEAAATASEAGKWGRASTLITQARQDIDAIEDVAGDEPIFQDIADIDDELEKLDEQIEQGNQPSSRKLRELARRMRVLSDD